MTAARDRFKKQKRMQNINNPQLQKYGNLKNKNIFCDVQPMKIFIYYIFSKYENFEFFDSQNKKCTCDVCSRAFTTIKVSD